MDEMRKNGRMEKMKFPELSAPGMGGWKESPAAGGAFVWNHFPFFPGYDIIKIEFRVSF